ncbi:MAG: O-antigen ligase family protein, partial [Crocinitomicaceae bacterium]
MNNAQPSQSRWKLILVITIICLVYLGYTGIESYSKTPKWIGLLCLALVLFLMLRKQGVKWSWGLSIWSVFILQYIIQSAASYNGFDALANSLPLLIGPFLVLALFRKQDSVSQLTDLGILVAFISFPLIAYGLIELSDLAEASNYTRTSSYQVRFSFGHKNQLSQFFTLLVPLYALGVVSVAEKWKKGLFVFSIFMIFVFVTLLMNRTSLILLYGVYPFVLIIYLIHKYLSTSLKKVAYGVVGGVVLIGFILIVTIPDSIPFVADWLHSESGQERLMIWQNSLELAKEAPIFGHGSGDWKIEILRTSLERLGSENQVFFQRAHNEFIHTLVENGIIGVLILIAFYVYSIFSIIRSSISFQMKLFSLTGVLSFLIISNLSFPLERVELVFLLFLFLLPSFKSVEQRKSLINYSLLGMTIMCLFFAVSWIRQERNFFLFKSEDEIDLTENISSFTLDGTSTPVSFYEGNYYFSRQKYQQAKTSFEEALERNPYHVHVLNNLASTQSLTGQIEEAKANYERLFSIDSTFTEGLINAASVCFNSGDSEQALEYLLRI